jgi:hypothetical protein
MREALSLMNREHGLSLMLRKPLQWVCRESGKRYASLIIAQFVQRGIKFYETQDLALFW